MKRLSPLLLLLAALLLPAIPSPADTPASQPLAPKVFVPAAPAPPPVFTPAGKAASTVAGTQGVQGVAGPAGAPGAGVGYSATLSGVTANTSTDQAPAIAAALTASKAVGLGVTLPPGQMTIQTPVAITATGFDGGTRLIGAGMNAQLSSPRGTTLLMGAENQDAVVRVGTGFMVGGEVSDLTLGGHGPPTAPDTHYGVHFAETNWTNFRLHRLYIQNVQTAIGVDYGTGNADGENLYVDQCLGGNVNCWYQNTSDQAYSHTEVASGATLNTGGTCYRLLSLGQNFYSLHGSSSFLTPSGTAAILTDTFLENDGADQSVFDTGRMEHCGLIIKEAAGTLAKVGHTRISNYHFTDMVDGSIILQTSSVNGQFGNVISDTEFDSPTAGSATVPTATLHILKMLNGDPNGLTVFNGVTFVGFKTLDQLGPPPVAGHYGGVVYNNCWQVGAVGALTPVSNVSSNGAPILSVTN